MSTIPLLHLNVYNSFNSDFLPHVFVFIFVSIIVFVNFIGCRNTLSYCTPHTTSSALLLYTYSLSTSSQDIVISFLFLWFRLLRSIIQFWKDPEYISIDITQEFFFILFLLFNLVSTFSLVILTHSTL